MKKKFPPLIQHPSCPYSVNIISILSFPKYFGFYLIFQGTWYKSVSHKSKQDPICSLATL